MSLKSKIILNALFGAIGGFAAWGLLEVLLRGFFATPFNEHLPADIVFANTKIGLLAGAIIGGMLGAADGMWARSANAMRRAFLVGCMAGAVGGLVGLTIGQTVFDLLTPETPRSEVLTFFSFIMRVFARAIGWTIVGAALGAAQGAMGLSSTRAKHGAIGGMIGGFLGGASFDIVANILRSDVFSRMISFTITGFTIGLMIGLLQDLMKQAWIVVLRDRNEGREIPIYKSVTTIGRDELADVPVFTDHSVAQRQAVIRVENGRRTLEDAGSVLGTVVDGQKVTRQALKDGDLIEMGSVKLLFREKATARMYTPPKETWSEAVSIPTSAHVCPFCGGVKDAQGNCECSVGSAPASLPPSPAQMQNPTIAVSAPPAALAQFGQVAGVARLSAIRGPHAGAVFELQPVETTIGREVGRDICLSSDTTVSRRHARIIREASGFFISDEGSSNGSFVNGSRITRAAIAPGDTITIGATELRFEM